MRLGRHCEALHELSAAEFEEKAKIEFQIVQFLREHTKCDKEYISCFSEAEGFNHIHVHIIPRFSASGSDDVGVLSFKHLKPEEKEIVPIETIQQFSNTLGAVLKRIAD